jgi:prophage regulatory protein
MARRLLRFLSVKERTGLSRTAIYDGVHQGTFPAPVKIGSRSSAWVEEEVEAWIQARIRERDRDNQPASSDTVQQ